MILPARDIPAVFIDPIDKDTGLHRRSQDHDSLGYFFLGSIVCRSSGWEANLRISASVSVADEERQLSLVFMPVKYLALWLCGETGGLDLGKSELVAQSIYIPGSDGSVPWR